MTRRFGRSGAGAWWLGGLVTLLGLASACGDDDGSDTPNGTGGAATGGAKTGGGTGGSQAKGGSAGAPQGGSGGSGGAKGGAGGVPSSAGDGGIPGDGGVPSQGGAGATAGNAGAAPGGNGGDAGAGTVAGAPNAGESGGGQPGTGGSPSGGSGTGGSSDAGSGGGGSEISVEYRNCEQGAAVTRLELYRIDRENETCTVVVVQQGQINCLEGLKSAGWCVISASLSDDVAACEAFQAPSDPIQATAGAGTFTVSGQPLAIDIDVDFDFPASSTLPETVTFEADNCLADCVANDCRP